MRDRPPHLFDDVVFVRVMAFVAVVLAIGTCPYDLWPW